MKKFWNNLGFGGRLSAMIIALVLFSVVIVAAMVYNEYRSTSNEAALNRLQGTSEGGAQSFMDWLLARQDELRLYASLDAFVEQDEAQMENLLVRLAEEHGYWDTIYFVDTSGVGQFAVSYDGSAEVLTQQQANQFVVADRDWFRSAVRGNEVFSEPLVSRASGNRVSTVVIPVYRDREIIGVLRGAVMLDTVTDRVQQLPVSDDAEVFVLAADGTAITRSDSIRNLDDAIDTQASGAISSSQDGAGIYPNAQGTMVVGAYNYIDLLGWGLVVEEPQSVALAAVSRMFWLLVVVVSIIVVIAAAICIAIARNVLSVIGGEPSYASAAVSKVAEGDLSTPITLKAGDDSSILASISSMQQRLREVISDISSYSQQVASASTQLSQVSDATQRGITEQNAQLSNAATAINEMSSTAEEVARNSQDAADAAQAANTEADKGQNVVGETVETVHMLSKDIAHSSDVVGHLKEDSDKIGKVLDVIGQIAEQTNLLALNAAIEAARAGESGRGFSVVADEVRTLASRTQASTQEIQQIISTLQNRADSAVQAMKGSSEAVDQAVHKVSSAGESLSNITMAANKINEMIQQIASAAEEQTMATREINQSIHSVSDIAEQASGHVKESVESSESLARLAEHLQDMVKRFRL
ncbi:methyl-accepting chemotaxis protein [Aliidiomarina sedimenti]|uniref:Methyl-accepting chemotaxis protein n=1 Tax=Aliidiomarina sedimenti TaxID=1933879 RepID=A0ABY0BV14_9GAMM|nr:methyl-accepting chemotaxis protein [Aliidiomarina sedimenti]RUO28107.1 methyl-accepting chemotaxis protein [Aliidiomarina sedimenti]